MKSDITNAVYGWEEYAGGGDYAYPQQQQMPAQNTYNVPVQETVEHIEVSEEHDEGMAHGAIHVIGENIGWGPLLIIILIGARKAWREKIIGIVANIFGLKLVKKVDKK